MVGIWEVLPSDPILFDSLPTGHPSGSLVLIFKMFEDGGKWFKQIH